MIETERKFLIRYPDTALLERICDRKLSIEQIYLVTEENVSRRIRKQECRGKTVYIYGEKERISSVSRIEREREIPEEEYTELRKDAVPGSKTIIKTRYCIPAGELCFEVDVFPEWNDRAFVEVELEDEDQRFTIPDCLSVIKEVTDDGRYTNSSLALNGFVYERIPT